MRRASCFAMRASVDPATWAGSDADVLVIDGRITEIGTELDPTR